jgi:hypothetical protein
MSLSSQTDILRCSYHARVDSEAWARAEMAKTAADPETFERRLKEQLERKLSGRGRFGARDNEGVWVEEVRLEGSYPDTTGVIILRDDRQPACRFAWSFGQLWDWRTFEDVRGADPDDHASTIEMYLDEDVEAVNYGIPIRCVEDDLTPVGLHEVSLENAARRAPFPVLAPSRAPAPGHPRVFYEERRRFYPFATAHLVYESRDGLVVSCQTERLRGEVPDTEWERVDRAIGEQTFVMWVLKDGPEAPFRVWPPLDPVRTVGATFDGFILYAQTDFLSRDDLLDMMASVEVVGREDDS